MDYRITSTSEAPPQTRMSVSDEQGTPFRPDATRAHCASLWKPLARFRGHKSLTGTQPVFGFKEFRSRQAGMTLAEMMIATALGSVVALGLASLTFFTARSFSAMANYVDLDHRSRMALDTMSREIRQANRLTDATSTSLTFEDYDGGKLQYIYDPSKKTLARIKNGVPDAKPLLEECTTLTFSIYQRNSMSGTYDQYTAATPATCKLVQMRWICSRKILGVVKNTESVQSAKVVIRKQ